MRLKLLGQVGSTGDMANPRHTALVPYQTPDYQSPDIVFSMATQLPLWMIHRDLHRFGMCFTVLGIYLVDYIAR